MGKRWEDFNEYVQKYREGEVTYPEVMLSAARQASGGIGDFLYEATPDVGFSEWLAKQEWAKKAAEKNQSLEEEYPRSYNAAAGLLGGASLGSGASLTKSLFNPQKITGAAAEAVSNIPNKIASFYQQGKGGEIGGFLTAAGRGVKNTLEQHMTARGQALRDVGLPVQLVNLAEESYKKIDNIKGTTASKRAEITNSAMPDSEKSKLLSVLDEGEKKELASISKTLMGQMEHDYFTKKQYAKDPNRIITQGTSSVSLTHGPFTKAVFKDMFPDVPEHLYDLISKNQKVGEAGILVARSPTASAGAAGILQRDVHKLSKVDKGVKSAFLNQELTTPFKSASSFFRTLEKGKITDTLRKKLEDPDLIDSFEAAFNKKNSSLKKATNLEAFQEALKENGIKMPKDAVELAFNRSPRKPFEDVSSLMAALEKQGVKISKAAKEKALERGYLTTEDSMLSNAIALGGTNNLHVVYPNGRKITVVNDGYDIFKQVAPGQARLVNVSPYSEFLLGDKVAPQNVLGVLKSTEKVNLDVPSPFTVGTNQQKKAFADLNEMSNIEPTLANKATAFRNRLLGGNLFSNQLLNRE